MPQVKETDFLLILFEQESPNSIFTTQFYDIHITHAHTYVHTSVHTSVLSSGNT